MIIPNIWENKKCSKPPTSYIYLMLDSQLVFSQIFPSFWWSYDHLPIDMRLFKNTVPKMTYHGLTSFFHVSNKIDVDVFIFFRSKQAVGSTLLIRIDRIFSYHHSGVHWFYTTPWWLTLSLVKIRHHHHFLKPSKTAQGMQMTVDTIHGLMIISQSGYIIQISAYSSWYIPLWSIMSIICPLKSHVNVSSWNHHEFHGPNFGQLWSSGPQPLQLANVMISYDI